MTTKEKLEQIFGEIKESEWVEYAKVNRLIDELAKERERAEKMVSDLDKLAEKYKAEGLYVSWSAIKQITCSYKNNLPPETTGNQTAC